jgi:hypothetical protein
MVWFCVRLEGLLLRRSPSAAPGSCEMDRIWPLSLRSLRFARCGDPQDYRISVAAHCCLTRLVPVVAANGQAHYNFRPARAIAFKITSLHAASSPFFTAFFRASNSAVLFSGVIMAVFIAASSLAMSESQAAWAEPIAAGPRSIAKTHTVRAIKQSLSRAVASEAARLTCGYLRTRWLNTGISYPSRSCGDPSCAKESRRVQRNAKTDRRDVPHDSNRDLKSMPGSPC